MEKQNRLVVADRGWAETIPGWLKNEVENERLIEGLAGAAGKGNGGKVGLSEVAVYLYTASLRGPLDYYHTQIYLYVTGKLIEQKTGVVPDVAKEVVEKGLDAEAQRLLDNLGAELYRKRGGEIHSPLFEALKALRTEIVDDRAPARGQGGQEAVNLPQPSEAPKAGADTLEGRGWRKHKNHREETQAVKKALEQANILVKHIGHGTGTAWAWLEINLGPNSSGLEHKNHPENRYGLCPSACPACLENTRLRDRALDIALEVTGRRGDYNGEINILAQ